MYKNRIPFATELIIPRGAPASGKSTWAAKKAAKAGISREVLVVSYDVYRTWPLYADLPLNEREAGVKAQLLEDIQNALTVSDDGVPTIDRTPPDIIIIDNTNLSDKTVKTIVDTAQSAATDNGITLNVVYEDSFLDVPLAECIRRDALREDPVGEKVIRRFYKQVQRIKQDKYTAIASKHAANVNVSLAPPDIMTQAIIVDLDGTLAHRSHRRGWFDNHMVDLDTVNTPVAEVVRAWIMYQVAQRNPFNVYFFSGRENIPIDQDHYEGFNCEQMTENWIKHHVLRDLVCLTTYKVQLREHGDTRADSIVKSEMYDQIPKDTIVQFVLDDRNSVVEMWRKEKGVACFQVAPGDF